MKNKPEYSRWAAWEDAVLAKCGELPELQAGIEKRRNEIDGDAEERETLRDQFYEFIRLRMENPKTAYLKIKVSDLFRFLQSKYPRDIAGANKVKAFVERHHVPEIVGHKKTKAGAVFIFRGADAKPDACLRYPRSRSVD